MDIHAGKNRLLDYRNAALLAAIYASSKGELAIMPRKKPFSNKQKKVQMQHKRQKKKDKGRAVKYIFNNLYINSYIGIYTDHD